MICLWRRLLAGWPPCDEGAIMDINKQSDLAGEMQIGPTDQGMVRIYVTAKGIDLPLDFTPDEAREIAEELTAAAARAETHQRK